MKLRYYEDTDHLYIDLVDRPGVDSLEVADGVVIDLDAHGNIVGLDIEHAAEKLDLGCVETVDLPPPLSA